MFPVKKHILQQKQQVTFSVILKTNRIQNTQIHILEHNWVGLSKTKSTFDLTLPNNSADTILSYKQDLLCLATI